MTFPFPTRTINSTALEHLDDHNEIVKALGRTALIVGTTRQQHLDEHNALHPTFGLPNRALGNAASLHLSDHQTLHADLVRVGLAAQVGTRASYGPRTISQPSGATVLSPGDATWANTINNGVEGQVFWFPTGTYTLGAVSTLNLKTNMKLVGQLGAVIDGTSNHQNGISNTVNGLNVEVDNLKWQNFTGYGLNWTADGGSARTGWTVHHNEVTACNAGINSASNAWVHHNYTHHNVQYGWVAFKCNATTFEWNESSNDNTTNVSIADQGATKFTNCTNMILRYNYLHDSAPWQTGNPHAAGGGSALWFDHVLAGGFPSSNNSQAYGNIVEDNHQGGIENEVGHAITIMYNTVRRNYGYHLFLSNADNTEVVANYVRTNQASTGARAMILQQNDDPDRAEPIDLINNNLHHNYVDISLPVGSGNWDVGLIAIQPFTDYATWEAAAKNNLYDYNQYKVASLTGSYWGHIGVLRTFAYWQVTPDPDRDPNGSQSL